ncbi:MAG: DUF3127 domain-containing protein [Chitinophagaceae bacterium]|nr:DUF3127 domain-containing protein [Chitinophagaceae bacterium]
MASFEFSGKLKVKGNTQVVSDKFSKRDFVIATEEQYPQFVSLQLTQDKCALLDAYNIGEELKLSVNLRGREWTAPDGAVKYFNTLDVWRIERLQSNTSQSNNSGMAPAAQEEMISSGEQTDDLPF